MKTKKLTELGLLTCLALIIFIIEMRIPNPVPIPGMKLGLANIITIYAIYHYTAKEVFLIVILRIVLGSIFSGNLVTLAYSLTGGMLCMIGMFVASKWITEKYIPICSCLGALLHNLGQIIIAIILMNNLLIVAYFPLLIVSGCITGMLTGICAYYMNQRLKQSNKAPVDMSVVHPRPSR